MEVLTSEDLRILTKEDLRDICNIIHVANCHKKLSEMRAQVVSSLKHAFQAQGVAFFLSDKDYKAIDNASIVSIGTDLRYLDRWVRHYSHYDPFQQDGLSRSVVCKVDDILPYKRWVNLNIYNEFYRPQNIHYKLSIHLRSSEKVLGLIGIFLPKERGDFSKRTMTMARILAPHLTTAVENTIQFSAKDETKDLFDEHGNKLPLFGIIVLDYDFRPTYFNSEAKEFCRALHREQQPRCNETTIENPPVPSEILQDCRVLKELFQTGRQSASLHRQKTMDIGQNKRFQVISSLDKHSPREGSPLKFFVYLLDLSAIYKGRAESLREKYQLSKREIEIVGWVCKGLTNDEIGEKLYISRFTVETHLKNIFDKTRVKRRTELASLLQSL
jgi:DNA-binding CsgD family transcriptional regulator